MNPRSRPLVRRALVVAALATLGACGGSDDDATTTPTEPVTADSPSAPDESDTGAATTAAVPTTPAAPASGGGGDVTGAELVCPAVSDSLSLATDAGWGPGAGAEDEAAKASITAQMVIALVLDDNDQTQALWDAVDAIGAAQCPDETQQLIAVYGGSTLRDILDAV